MRLNIFSKGFWSTRSPVTLSEFINGYALEDEDPEKFLSQLYKNPFTSSAITRINEAINNLKWGTYKKGYGDNVRDVKSSYVLNTLQNPNPLLNTDQFINYFALYYILFGELLVMRIDLYTKAELILLKKGSYYIEYDNQNVLNGIKSIRVNGKEYKGEELKMFHYIKGVNIYDNIAGAGYGTSKVQSLTALHNYWCYIMQWNNSILRNGGKRNLIIVVKKFLNAFKKKEIKNEIEQNSGSRNVGKALILDGEGAEIKEADFSPQDFDFLNAMDEIRNTTAAVMNVPSILIGDRTNSKFSNYKEAKKDLYTENILPLVEQIAEYLNNIMKDKLESNEYIDFDTSTIGVLKEDRKEKMAMLNNLSYLTINEKRAELEYPPVENGDDILISTSMTSLKEMYEEEKPVEEEDDDEETESSKEENEENQTD